MTKFWLITQRECKERLSQRGFWWMLILGPMVVLFLLVALLLAADQGKEKIKVLIADPGQIMEHKVLAQQEKYIEYYFLDAYLEIDELMDAVDSYIQEPVRDNEKPFLMPVEDVFTITGRGTVATGRIETGVANTGDAVDIIGMGAEKLASTVTGVEMFRKILDRGEAGDNVGILLRGIEKTDIKRGMVICKPGSVAPHAKFEAEVYILKKEEGGRHTPFHNKYRPQFYIRTTDVTGEIFLPKGTDMVMPGDNLTITVELIAGVAMNEGLRFAIREGGRTVGAGQVTEILD